MTMTPVRHELADVRVLHGRVFDTEVYDGAQWVPAGRLLLSPDFVAHDDARVHTSVVRESQQALLLHGKVGDPAFRARLNMTADGTAFVGTMASGTAAPRAFRGAGLTVTYRTRRRPQDDPNAPFESWDDLSIHTEWVEGELKVTYLLGDQDISDRTRVTKVDRAKGETWLEMAQEVTPPFDSDHFAILLVSGSRSFGGTYTSDDETTYDWTGEIADHVADEHATAFRSALAAAPADATVGAPDATLSLQDLDNISSIQIVTAPDGKQMTVDYAQTTCGKYFNKGLANCLDDQWVNGIYGHRYDLPAGAQQVVDASKTFFTDNAVLGTGQMLYDNLATWPQYSDLLKRVDGSTMETAWKQLGKDPKTAPAYETATNAMYIQGYRDGVPQMQGYLEDDPEGWASRYFDWLSDDANLLTWQLQVASGQFDNVKTRIYEWYVKLQVLAPDHDYGERFTSIAYAALLGVAFSRSTWSDDLKPYLEAMIENAVKGQVDPSIMTEIQQQAAKENQELLQSLVTTADQITLLVDAIAAGLTSYAAKKRLQQLANDPGAQAAIAQHLDGAQFTAWSDLSTRGKLGGVLSTAFYGASAAFLIYNIVEDSKSPQTPKQVVSEVNLGVLALAILVKGVEKLMSIGVGRALQRFARAGEGGAFRTFAEQFATWFQEGGKVVPEGPFGKAMVSIFGENSAEFLARRIGPAMAVVGLVLAAFTLADAIKSGDVRNIIFESLNTFVALASVVLIGLELMSFAWAGPAGLVVAAIGIVITLVQLIWNLVDPPAPPPDPITEFVTGPMVTKGYAH
ncbi:hypothetical protein SAMN05443575_2223 [Jatrophihabitans endophyticus]|uniref:Uncharacterized protein n=1 Tax=Jatrophihabitans endophyticus TaxID=1206085 RepID=A0A1M5KQJ3_9ACTN|nr:hypothetical protein [Jatrophihabitans endophyticus]SHG54779.1 hypothetical protein SAMN05443575_2223 [Jatrophihabitans endophyticus]